MRAVLGLLSKSNLMFNIFDNIGASTMKLLTIIFFLLILLAIVVAVVALAVLGKAVLDMLGIKTSKKN